MVSGFGIWQVETGKIHWDSRFIRSIEGHTFLSAAVDTRKSTVTFSLSFWPMCSQFSSSCLVLCRMPRLLIIPVWEVLLGLELYIMQFRNIENWLGASGNWRVLSVGRSTVNLIVRCDDEGRTWGPQLNFWMEEKESCCCQLVAEVELTSNWTQAIVRDAQRRLRTQEPIVCIVRGQLNPLNAVPRPTRLVQGQKHSMWMSLAMFQQIYDSGDSIAVTPVHRLTVPGLFIYVISNILACRFLEMLSCERRY